MDAADAPRPPIVAPAETPAASAAPPSSAEQPAPPPPASTATPPPAVPSATAPDSTAAPPLPPPPASAPSSTPATSAPPPATTPPAPPPAAHPLPPAATLVPTRSREEVAWTPPASQVEAKAPMELGVGTFFLSGGGSGSYVGVTPFFVADLGQAVFLRPSLALGTSVATNVPSTFAAARIDTCMRLPGRYAVRGGLQLDVCGGVDAGASYVSSGTTPGTPADGQMLPYVDLGPSIDLRAEAGDIGITMRAAGGVDVTQGSYTDVTGTKIDLPVITWQLEVDLSWVFHDPRDGEPRTETGSL